MGCEFVNENRFYNGNEWEVNLENDLITTNY